MCKELIRSSFADTENCKSTSYDLFERERENEENLNIGKGFGNHWTYQAHYTGTIEFGGACNCRAYRARYAARRA